MQVFRLCDFAGIFAWPWVSGPAGRGGQAKGPRELGSSALARRLAGYRGLNRCQMNIVARSKKNRELLVRSVTRRRPQPHNTQDEPVINRSPIGEHTLPKSGKAIDVQDTMRDDTIRSALLELQLKARRG